MEWLGVILILLTLLGISGHYYVRRLLPNWRPRNSGRSVGRKRSFIHINLLRTETKVSQEEARMDLEEADEYEREVPEPETIYPIPRFRVPEWDLPPDAEPAYETRPRPEETYWTIIPSRLLCPECGSTHFTKFFMRRPSRTHFQPTLCYHYVCGQCAHGWRSQIDLTGVFSFRSIWCPSCGDSDVTHSQIDGITVTYRVHMCRHCGHTWHETLPI
jgi:rubredoxin